MRRVELRSAPLRQAVSRDRSPALPAKVITALSATKITAKKRNKEKQTLLLLMGKRKRGKLCDKSREHDVQSGTRCHLLLLQASMSFQEMDSMLTGERRNKEYKKTAYFIP